MSFLLKDRLCLERSAKRSKKGNAAVELLVVFSFIIYILLPLFVSLLQIAFLYHYEQQIKQAVELSVSALIVTNNTSKFASGLLEIDIDNNALQEQLYETIQSFQIDILDIERQNIVIRKFNSNTACSCGYICNHFVISADILGILNFMGERSFMWHKHMEFPIAGN